MGEIEFHVYGEPKPQPRPRAFARKTPFGVVARVFDAGTAEGWKSLIADAVRPLLPPSPIEAALSVSMTFWLPRPKTMMSRRFPDCELPHCGRIDCDNLAKAALDTLTQLGAWRDDGQVTRLVVSKFYASKTGRPGMHMALRWDEERVAQGDLLSGSGAA